MTLDFPQKDIEILLDAHDRMDRCAYCATPRSSHSGGCVFCYNPHRFGNVPTGYMSPSEAAAAVQMGMGNPAFPSLEECEVWKKSHQNDTRAQRWERAKQKLVELDQGDIIPRVEAILKKDGWLQ